MKKWVNLKTLLPLLLVLNGCACYPLSVQAQYIGRENLASYYVNTPDPHLTHPDIGQRLVINWSLPKEYLAYSDLYLFLKVRFRNHEEEEKNIPIKKASGTYLYYVLNEKFHQSGGLLTYKVDIIGDGCILEEWQHQLWTELITFDISES